MKTNRIWVEIMLLGTAIACVLALLLATLGAAAGVAAGEEARQETTSPALQIHEGMVSCSRCGARHSAATFRRARWDGIYEVDRRPVPECP